MGIPSRWLPYTKFGQPIPGTRFIAFKCPLQHDLCQNMPEDYRFTPSLLLQNLPAVKLVIDLTFTTRYYKKEEFEETGRQHVKILCGGKSVPNKANVMDFFSAVDTFLANETDGLIGVHCTHGVNRTGFLICKYMIAKLGFQPQDAIKAFGDARGHHIERAAYIQSLGIKQRLAETLVGEQPEDIILDGVNTGSRYRRDCSPHRQHRGLFYGHRGYGHPHPCGFSPGYSSRGGFHNQPPRHWYPPRGHSRPWRSPNSWQNRPYPHHNSNRGNHYNSSYDRPRGDYRDFHGSYYDHWGPPRDRRPMNRDRSPRNERWVRDVKNRGARPSRNWDSGESSVNRDFDSDISPPGVDKE